MRFSTPFRFTGRLDRGQYALAGVLLFALKYNLDRVLSASVFGRRWSFSSYLSVPGAEAIDALGQGDIVFGLTLVATALPFVWIGTALTTRRLRDSGLPIPLVLLFFVPVVNLLFFSVMCVLPGRPSPERTTESSTDAKWLDRVMPEGRLASAGMAVAVTAPAGLIGTYLAVNVFSHYGWGLFVGIPFGLGMVAAMLNGYRSERSPSECMLVAITSVAILGGLLALVAAEGLICLVMAAPIAVALAVMGGGLGYCIQRRPRTGSTVTMTLVVAGVLPFVIALESVHDHEADLVAVTTAVAVEATAEEVWDALVVFSDIPAPSEWLFKTGIAYPVRATIEGQGAGAVRYCEFTTGSFVEPITVWNRPTELSFSVESMPDPMHEWTFYGQIRPPHIDGYFSTEKGRFLLTETIDGQTLLEGTTWYRNRLWPNRYWNAWSDAILHRIHLRVLTHIKRTAETSDA
ncbi:MAG: DUF805 domain-containing protein [Rhodothermia bacterium]|nr:DUF805 domain-containing protein [Rhodothermia bacterium]